MNEWSKKSAEIARSKNYLDQLQEIYPANIVPRDVSAKDIQLIRDLFQKKEREKLLFHLLTLEKFPYEEPYKAYLQIDSSALKNNPQVVCRITDQLFQMGEEKVIAGVTNPKAANQKMASHFKKWAKNNFRYCHLEAFNESENELVFLDGTDKILKNYASVNLGIGLKKGIDFVAKADETYVIGEAKYIGNEGGSQDRGFDDAVSLAGQAAGRAVKVAVLDGVVWLPKSSFFKKIQTSSINIMSALVLKDYLTSL